jgi:hypothetical protein
MGANNGAYLNNGACDDSVGILTAVLTGNSQLDFLLVYF